jgi:hypothetical protein
MRSRALHEATVEWLFRPELPWHRTPRRPRTPSVSLDTDNSINAAEAESLARTAAADFEKHKAGDLVAQSCAYLARALLAQGKRQEARVVADRGAALSRQEGDLAVRFEAGLAAAAVEADSGSISEAAARLESLRGDAGRHGYGGYELQAELQLGSAEIQSGNAAAGRARLQRLRGSAQDEGFLLVARKASEALRTDPSRR